MNNGKIVWTDLTVQNAEEVRDFYQSVLGWKSTDHSMGEYNDYVMQADENDQGTAGICHAKGANANMPAQWLVYVQVESVAAASEACLAQGGKIIDGPRQMGNNLFAVIQDPAGAVLGIIEA